MEDDKMKTKIGGMQSSIRELKEDIKLIKNEKDYIEVIVKNLKQENIRIIEKNYKDKVNLIKEQTSSIIMQTFSKFFNEKVTEHTEIFNDAVKMQSKGFNSMVNNLLVEMATLRKDQQFIMNLVMVKLKIDEKDIQKLARYFNKQYPKEETEDYINSLSSTLIHNKEAKDRFGSVDNG